MERIKVLIADDSESIVSLVSELLQKHPSIQIIATANDGNEALQRAESMQPDLIVADLDMPGLSGVQLLLRLKKSCPRCQMILMTGHEQLDVREACIAGGALGLIFKSALFSSLPAEILRAYQKPGVPAEERV